MNWKNGTWEAPKSVANIFKFKMSSDKFGVRRLIGTALMKTAGEVWQDGKAQVDRDPTSRDAVETKRVSYDEIRILKIITSRAPLLFGRGVIAWGQSSRWESKRHRPPCAI